MHTPAKGELTIEIPAVLLTLLEQKAGASNQSIDEVAGKAIAYYLMTHAPQSSINHRNLSIIYLEGTQENV